MSDIADNANEYVQMIIDNAIRNRTTASAVFYKACRNCKNPTSEGSAFCDSDCRDDFDKRNK